MPKILFKNFLGMDTQNFMPKGATRFAQTLKNLIVNKVTGSLVKAGSYTDAATTLVGTAVPAAVGTIKSLFEFNVNRSSNKDIIMLQSEDASSKARIYAGNYFDNNSLAFQNDWQELTEHFGRITLAAADISAGTDATQIVIDSTNSEYANLSSAAGYYNKWIMVVNIVAKVKTAVIVTDYAVGASTKTFSVVGNSLTGIAASDTITLARSPLFADGIADTITSNRYADITQLDNIVRFKQRENACLLMTGNAREFPTQYQMYYMYHKWTYGNPTLSPSDTTTHEGYFLESQQLVKPYIDDNPGSNEHGVLLASASGSGSGLAAGTYKIYVAYEYDGFQIGALSDAYEVVVTSGQTITIEIQVPLNGCYDDVAVTIGAIAITVTNKHIRAYDDTEVPEFMASSLIQKRVTAIRTYLSEPGSDVVYFKRRYPIAYADNFEVKAPPLAVTDDLVMAYEADTGLLYGTDTVTTEESFNGNSTYETDAGGSGTQPNFKYGQFLDGHFLAASIRNINGTVQSNDVISSVIDGAGVTAFDVFAGQNNINLGYYGARQITGIAVIGDEGKDVSPKSSVVIFTDNDLYILGIVSGLGGGTFAHKVDAVLPSSGTDAPDGIISVNGIIYYPGKNGFKAVVNGKDIDIGLNIKPTYDTLTTTSDASAAYFENENMIVWLFPTDNKYFWLDLASEGFQMGEFDFNADLTFVTSLINGGVLSTDGSKIYTHEDGTTQDSNSITPVYESIYIDSSSIQGYPPGALMKFSGKFGMIHYKSNTDFTLTIQGDRSETTEDTITVPSNSTGGIYVFKIGLDINVREVSIKAEIASGNLASNTSFQINWCWLDAEILGEI